MPMSQGEKDATASEERMMDRAINVRFLDMEHFTDTIFRVSLFLQPNSRMVPNEDGQQDPLQQEPTVRDGDEIDTVQWQRRY